MAQQAAGPLGLLNSFFQCFHLTLTSNSFSVYYIHAFVAINTNVDLKFIVGSASHKATAVLVAALYLPAGVWGLPLQYVLCERRRLQLILVEGHLVYHHGLGVQTGETDVGVGRARGLGGTGRRRETRLDSMLPHVDILHRYEHLITVMDS